MNDENLNVIEQGLLYEKEERTRIAEDRQWETYQANSE